MSVTTVRLQPEVEEGLEAMADKLHRTKSWLINQALREYIERETAERVRWHQTLKAMESVARGQIVDGDAVHAWLETWGTENELSAPSVGK